MAVFHCTRKLAERLPGVSAAPIAESGALGNWHATLVRFDRLQCVLFCHDETRYCLFLPRMRARQLAELGCWHRDLFAASLALEGIADPVVAGAQAALGPARFDSDTDRSVLGSINIALGDLQVYVAAEDHVLDVDALLVSRQLNGRPAMANGKLLWPGPAMRACVETGRMPAR
jgi:hypothetical protein